MGYNNVYLFHCACTKNPHVVMAKLVKLIAGVYTIIYLFFYFHSSVNYNRFEKAVFSDALGKVKLIYTEKTIVKLVALYFYHICTKPIFLFFCTHL